MRTIQAVLDEANPTRSPEAQHQALLGSALALAPRFVKALVVANVLALPDAAKAARVVRAFATAGGAPGMLAPVTPEGAVAAGQVGVTPTGDILFAAADAVTAAEVVYEPLEEGGVFTDAVDVAASAATLLQGRGAQQLLSVEVTTGVVLGLKTIDARGSAAPAAGEVALTADGLGLVFNVADVIAGKATVRYASTPGQGAGTTPTLAQRLALLVGY